MSDLSSVEAVIRASRASLETEAFTRFIHSVHHHRFWSGFLGVHLEHASEPEDLRLGCDDYVF